MMWWLTLRLQRNELVLLVLLTTVIVVALLATRTDVIQESTDYTVADCPGRVASWGNGEQTCLTTPSRLYRYVTGYLPGLIALPFIAATLVTLPTIMELAGRRFRLAWLQSLPRDRWVTRRLSTMLVLGVGTSALVGMVMYWWAGPRDDYWGGWAFNSYDLRGLVPVGNVLFAIGLMLVIGTLLRHVIVTLTLSGVIYFITRILFGEEWRNRLVPAETDIEPGVGDRFGTSGDPSQWILNMTTLDPSGADTRGELGTGPAVQCSIPEVSTSNGIPSFEQAQASNESYNQCLAELGYTTRVTYHPEAHYWPLQIAEAGIFAAIGLALTGWTAWYWLRRLE